MTQSSNDELNLSQNKVCLEMLSTEGLKDEKIELSLQLQKINRKGKKQDRVLLITNKAIYNLKPNSYKKSQRRISIEDVGMITLSTTSPEFVIHVPSEYDYHLVSKQSSYVSKVLSEIYNNVTGGDLLIVQSELKHLKDIVLTQKLAKFEVKK